MKIKLDIDATPQELRTFFGLPDVEPMQQEVLDRMREKMLGAVENLDPANLMRPFLPGQMQDLAAWQKAFWQGVAGRTPEQGEEGEKE